MNKDKQQLTDYQKAVLEGRDTYYGQSGQIGLDALLVHKEDGDSVERLRREVAHAIALGEKEEPGSVNVMINVLHKIYGSLLRGR